MSTFRRRMMMKAKEQQSSVEDLDYFTVVPEIEDGVTMQVTQGFIEQELDFESNYYTIPYDYRIDDGEWVRVDDAFDTDSPPSRRIYVPFGSKLQLKSDAVSFLEKNEYDYAFNVSIDTVGSYSYYSIEGTFMSLIFGEPRRDFDLSRPLIGLPSLGGTDLLRINNPGTFLPSRILYPDCYNFMFNNCKSLVNAPELPATTLADSCYYWMFEGCTSLTKAPELPATTLANSCYYFMFHGCTNLNYIKMLATDISANSCLEDWVKGVASTGTFVKSKDATWDVVGDSGVPTGWTVITDEEESGGG